MNVSSSLSGMRAAELMLAVSADNTANLDTPGYHAERADLTSTSTGDVLASLSRNPDEGVDLAQETATDILGQFLYAANARVIQARRDTEQSLFDMLA